MKKKQGRLWAVEWQDIGPVTVNLQTRKLGTQEPSEVQQG